MHFKDAQLPAKQVLRISYCIAKNLPVDSKFKFSSGDTSLLRLRKLGFEANRVSA